MDIGKPFSFVFEDQNWLQKLLIGGLITLGGILFSWTVIGALVAFGLIYGYMIDLVRNVRRGAPNPLPEWDEWGDKMVKGLKLIALQIIWALPLILVVTPSAILSSLLEGSGDTEAIAALISLCFGCLATLYGIFLALVIPAITIRFAETNEFSSGLKFSDILAFTRAHIGDVIIATILVFAVQIIASIVGVILCGVGLLFTSFWAYLVQGHLYGQIGLKKGGQAVGETAVGETAITAGAVGETRVRPYDLSPEDIMPGVGELIEDVETGADAIVADMEDLGDAVDDVLDLPDDDKI